MPDKLTKFKNRIILLLVAACLPILPLSGCACSPPLQDSGNTDDSEVIQESADKETTAVIQSMKAPEIIEENINHYEITISGMKGEYDLLFLTDTHIVISDDNASPQINEYSRQRLSHFTGENGGIYPSDQFNEWIDYINKTKPDALLLGGDIIDSPASANIEFLDSCLKKLETPYIYTLGNHDWTFPWEYMTESGDDKYLPEFLPYMKQNTAIHTFESEYFSIVAVDNSSNQINPASLEKYKNILAQDKPVILMLHVPLYTPSLLAKTSVFWHSPVTLGGGIHGGIYPNETSTEFIGLTTAADSPVTAILAGHVHLEDRSDIPGEKNIPQITGDAGYKGKAALIHLTGSSEN